MQTLSLIEVYLDIGSGKYGTIYGVDKLGEIFKHNCPNGQIHVVKPDDTTNELIHQTPIYPKAKYIEALTPFFENKLTPVTKSVLDKGELPVIISSNHVNAMGNLGAFLAHHKDKKVGVLWIDAHADLHTVYTTPSGNLHGTPLATAIGDDNLDCQENTPPAEVVAYWERLKTLGGADRASLKPDDIYFFGLRSFEPPETHLIEKHNIFAVSAVEHRADFGQILDTVVAKLKDYDTLYVSFDVDALDDRLIPATGTPEPQGYEVAEMRTIFDKVLTLPNVGLFEITEFNPTLDNDEDKHQHIYELFGYALGLLKTR